MINIPDSRLPRVVIIGGGFAGITLAQGLLRLPVQVVMIDRHNYHTFQCLLYQVATCGLEPDSIAFPLRKMFKKQKNFFFRMAEVQEVDPAARKMSTSIGDLSYDYLVIATGSLTNYFGIPGLEELAHGMKDIPEALDLRSLILQNLEQALITTGVEEREAHLNFVVVGAGPTGVEMAGALAELKKHILPRDYPELDIRRMQIHLVEAGPRPLAAMSEKASSRAQAALEKLDVQLWMNTRVVSFNGMTIATDSGKHIPAKTVIWSAGVKGNPVKGFETAGQNRIPVNSFNQITGHENVFAIGDVALMEEARYPKGHPMMASVATQQGAHLAKNLALLLRGKVMQPFRYKDKGSMATIGRNKAVADLGRRSLGGIAAWVLWMGFHLWMLAGFRNRLIVFMNWFWSYITYDRGTRLIIRPFKGKRKTFSRDVRNIDKSGPKEPFVTMN